ncbi:phytase [Cognataquiflexum rubidum]|uniref:phytase n=1 Tax=Cognataquiflexum rubidum TaxID=2922273 RepID=UPI001F12A99E|nr:phytase [Cognataquiflexum rubidum]MCH6233126.1 phytase [Cognataquiflexum rubidum]
MIRKFTAFSLLISLLISSCQRSPENTQIEAAQSIEPIKPIYVTDSVIYDTDDPAIWVNPTDPSKSLIIGTDKDADGALYVFDLSGKKIDSLIVRGLQRPNNVDVAYGLKMGDSFVDFAVTGERMTSKLRFYSLPDMKEIQVGGVEVYQGETAEMYRDLMGVAVYHDKSNGKHYVIAGRKTGPTDGTYLWQYEIKGSETGITLELVRKFGNYSGKKEIEAIAVDNELGFIYYSDEGVGVRKYYADPAKGNEELALFATEGFNQDHEGISIYKLDDTTGYILVSDQEVNQFHVFPREGAPANPHQHNLITIIKTSTVSSDGSEVTSLPLNSTFTKGLFVAMSDDKTFQLYKWEDLAGDLLKSRK